MRRSDPAPDPDTIAALDAIDATLAGEPVDPVHAELAELALLLADERPVMRAEAAYSLDQRVSRRFAPVGADPASRPRLRERRWLSAPAFGGVAASLAVAVVAVVIVVNGSGTGGPASSALQTLSVPANNRNPAPTLRVPAAGAAASHAAAAPGAKAAPTASTPSEAASPAASAGGSAFGGGSAGSAGSAAAASGSASAAGASAPSTAAAVPAPTQGGIAPPAPQPPGVNRQITQSAELYLGTAPSHIDQVAQELFDVVASVKGFVNSSNVTQGNSSDSYAEFTLSVPSSSLSTAMTDLSRLHYAQVISRTDASQDVTDQYNKDVNALNDARALRTSLLKQLANATTQTQIDSLKAQINDAEASISSDAATLRGLQHQISYSQIQVTIQPPSTAVPITHGTTGGFGLRKAAHDAGRVLTVAAGVALISLAVLLPVALVALLFWWVGATVTRRRREHALDLA